MQSAQPPANLPAGFQKNIEGPQIASLEVPVVAPSNNTIEILGQAIPKKYFYIFVLIVLAVIIYFIWKWYSNKKNSDDESEESDEEESEEKEVKDEEGDNK